MLRVRVSSYGCTGDVGGQESLEQLRLLLNLYTIARL